MIYDLIIIGGSAAATSAAIYAARRNLNFKIVSKDIGGEVATSGEIGNWPGIPQTDGLTLARQFREHLDYYRIEPHEGVEVKKIKHQKDGTFCISVAADGMTMAVGRLNGHATGPTCDYLTRSIIVATGVHPRELNIPGEKEFRNRGVSYCTVCDGPLMTGKTVATIGGGNSALESALMLADISDRVYVLNIMPSFTGEQVLIDNLMTKRNVQVIFEADTREIIGNDFVTGLKYNKGGKGHELKVDGIFVHIGMIPNSQIIPDDVKRNELGEIIVNSKCETNVPGLFAAGDVTDVPFKQIVIAAGQGTVAALSVVNYLNKIKNK